jgi:hypothetical protein
MADTKISKKEYATLAAALRAWAPGAPKAGELKDDPLLATGEVESLIGKLKGLASDDDELSSEEKVKRHTAAYDAQAKAQNEKDAADRKHRQGLIEAAALRHQTDDNVQPGNPGPGQPSLVTEAAKRLGVQPEAQRKAAGPTTPAKRAESGSKS